jgi:hypothetical protein
VTSTDTAARQTFGATVVDAGGGEVRLLVDRDTTTYPAPGQRVLVIDQSEAAGSAPQRGPSSSSSEPKP